MIASDLIRAVVALGFMLTIPPSRTTWLLYPLSALLMVASPFFTSGRSAILPSITSPEELHTANSLTQTTQWTTITIGTLLGGPATEMGYQWAFILNSLSFVVLGRMHLAAVRCRRGFTREARRRARKKKSSGPGTNTRRACATCARRRCSSGIALIGVGWATGGGAAQILFTLFGEQVFNRGPAGIGYLWAAAGWAC